MTKEVDSMRWSVVLGLLILAGLVFYLNPAEIFKAIIEANIWYFVLAIALNFVALIIQSFRFRSLANKFTKTNRKFKPYFILQAIANMSTYLAPANTGQVVKNVFLKKLMDVPYSKGLSIFFMERFQEFLSVYVILTSLILLISVKVESLSQYLVPVLVLFIIIIGGTIFAITADIEFFVKFIPEKYRTLFDFKTLQKSIKSVFGYKLFTKTMLLSIIVQFISITRVYLSFLAFGVIPDPTILAAVYLVSLLIAVLTFMPGGLGTFETSAFALYSTAFPYADALIGAILLAMRFFGMGFDVLGGWIALNYLERVDSFRKNKITYKK